MLALIFFYFGVRTTKTGWNMGKGLVAPIVVIGVVMGSIYGGITGITEAAGMGAFAVLVIAISARRSILGPDLGQPDAHAEINRNHHLGDDWCGRPCGGLYHRRWPDIRGGSSLLAPNCQPWASSSR